FGCNGYRRKYNWISFRQIKNNDPLTASKRQPNNDFEEIIRIKNLSFFFGVTILRKVGRAPACKPLPPSVRDRQRHRKLKSKPL
ncbi:MAG: hypothetical protein ACKO7P_16230, partial [Bacteroidota bacterium]